MAQCVIYIPGLGDMAARNRYSENVGLKPWKLLGLNTYYFPLSWADKEPFEPKFKRLLAKIDQLQGQGNQVSLVGVSAGASAAINAYAQRKDLNAVVLICGKIQNPQTVNRHYYIDNPAFEDSLATVAQSLESLGKKERAHIMSIHPIWDNTVPVKDTKIDGTKTKTVPVFGHIPGIFYSVTVASPAIAKFLKNPPQTA